MDKKGQIIEGGIVLIILIIVIAALSAYFRATDYECSKDKDCGNGYFCDDHECRTIPIIEKQPVIVERDYRSLSGPAFILGFFILLAVIVFKTKREHISGMHKIFSKSEAKKQESPSEEFVDIEKIEIHKEAHKHKKIGTYDDKDRIILIGWAIAIFIVIVILIWVLFKL